MSACASEEYGKRWFLVGSNMMFLVPILYSIKTNYKMLFPEIISLTSAMIASFLYHMCNSLDKCTQICVGDPVLLQKLDFIFAFQLIAVASTYSVELGFLIYKLLLLTITMVGNIVYVTTYKQYQDDDVVYSFVMIGATLCIAIIKIIYLYRTGKLPHEIKYHFNIRYGIAALISAAIGIYCFYTKTDSNSYWYFHSSWHMFIALALFFEFRMHNTNVCYCAEKRECQECTIFLTDVTVIN